jgi:tetratricopeptide (TPR) repeat protein
MNRIEKLNELLKATPQDCFLWHALGLEYIKVAELQKAYDSFSHLLTNIDEDYVGTYYHVAKTLEKMNRNQEAIQFYEKGIAIAQKVKDQHARNELRMALDDLRDE